MGRTLKLLIAAAGAGVLLAGGTAVAAADDADTRRRLIDRLIQADPVTGGGSEDAGDDGGPADDAGAEAAAPPFEIEIDPELDAQFGPRPVNAVQAAEIVVAAFPGARVVKAELEEENGGPTWDVEFVLGGDENEVGVDAVTGQILGDDGEDDDDGDDSDDDDSDDD